VLETIVQNPELNSSKLYVVVELIPQAQPPPPHPHLPSPQPQLPSSSPQPLPYNNLDLNDPTFSYNNLETQDAFDIYTSYIRLLSQNDYFSDAQQTSFHQQNYHPSQYFTTSLHHNILQHHSITTMFE